jgi:pimeloyl-ACP methyl ester carboxylesterase
MPQRPTICFLPGLLCDDCVWDAQSRAFRGEAEIYVPRFLGMDSLSAMAERVLAETSGPIWVAGHSMGGRVALEVWRLAPPRVAGLALLDTGVDAAQLGEARGRLELVERARAEGMDAVVRDWLPSMVHPSRHDEAAVMAPMAEMIRRATPDQYEKQQHGLLNRPDATGYLPNIRCPTAVIVGRQDILSSVALNEAMAAAVPGATLTVIEDCGHMAPVERPDEVTTALRAWLGRGWRPAAPRARPLADPRASSENAPDQVGGSSG